MLNANLAGQINVELIDEEENTIVTLGTVLVSASYSLTEVVAKIINKFALRGWMEFAECRQSDIKENKYRQNDAEDYVTFNFKQLITPSEISENDLPKLQLWLDNVICDIRHKPLLIHKYAYTEKQKEIIIQALKCQ